MSFLARDFFKEALVEPKRQLGAPIPLFDLLVDEDPLETEENPIRRFYSQEELIDSIQNEISRILGTRSSLKKEDMGELETDVLNIGFPPLFGLSDFSHYDATSQLNYARIAKLCEEAIGRYEPRIKNVRVQIKSFDRYEATLHGSIQATLLSSIYQAELNFPMTLKI